jgi:predicted anti-sigma-YlaC factor YlaD
MVSSHRHSASQATATHRAPPANDVPADAPGISEAGAWWRQLRAAVPRWLLVAVALLALGLLLYWYARA